MRLWVLTVIVAAAPSLFLLTFFYLKDRYEREPLQHILMAFGLGLYGAYPYYYDDYYPYYANDDYYEDGCYVVKRRVYTRYGWRVRPVQVCV